MSYGYADIASSDVGAVNASIGATHSESIEVAEIARQKELAYQRKRLVLLCGKARHVAGHGQAGHSNGMVHHDNGHMKKKLVKYAIMGTIAYLAFKGLTR